MACNDICIAFIHETSRRVGCDCMVGVNTVFGVSTLCWCSMYFVSTWLIDTVFGVRW